jgi:uncharacterized protein
LSRIVLLLIIGFLAYLAFRGFNRTQTRDGEPSARNKKGEDMVACARCGVHLPRSEAQSDAGVFTCQDNPRCRAP